MAAAELVRRDEPVIRQRARTGSECRVPPMLLEILLVIVGIKLEGLFLRFRGLQTGIRRNCFHSKHL